MGQESASPKIIRHFPRAVREIENLWIPLSDGCRLAARIWLPEDAGQDPVPAILEYLPYRKRDGTAQRDELTHPYFAGHGYASVRVDMRGTGESDGLLLDEYLLQEQDDALEVIDWLSRQPWCSGNVGMMGISWGGFNGLQVASRRPPALKAIITLCSTDDRYADDIHYKGGALLLENLGWASTMFSYLASIPDPELVGEHWRRMWLERLEKMPLLIANWLEHQHRDDYWKHGSICEDFAAIQVPVYAIGGWNDAYRNAVGRMTEHLHCPKKSLIGPWSHKYPHFATPGPAIGFLQEALRWWDHWLKGADNGIMEEPRCTFYIQDWRPADLAPGEGCGFWVQQRDWPPSNLEWRSWQLGSGSLTTGSPAGAEILIDSPLTAGKTAGEYCPLWGGPEFPADQRPDDAFSACFDSDPLEQPLILLGGPQVELEISSNTDCGQLVVRLNDVFPEGRVERITYGVLNLEFREGFETPRPLQPEKRYRIRLRLDDIGRRIPAGHRLRLALSTACFPLLWPARRRSVLTCFTRQSRLLLPVLAEWEQVEDLFPPPETARPIRRTELQPAEHVRRVTEDLQSGQVTTVIEDDFGRHRLDDHGLEVGRRCREEYSILPDDPLSASASIEWNYRAARGDLRVHVESRCTLTADENEFQINASQTGWEGETEVHSRNWLRRVRRSGI